MGGQVGGGVGGLPLPLVLGGLGGLALVVGGRVVVFCLVR